MEKIPPVVCIGEACIDIYIAPVARRFLGGSAVNTAVAFCQAGMPASFFGAIGSDHEGDLLLTALHTQGVDTRLVQRLPGRTNQSHTRLDPSARPEFLHALNPPRLLLPISPSQIDQLIGSPLVHYTSLDPELRVLHELRARHLLLCIDYGRRTDDEFFRASLPLADIAFASLPEERAHEAPALARDMRRAGVRLAVILTGRQGSLADNGTLHTQAAVPVEVVDTLGAGDAYIGAFLAGWLRGASIPVCMESGAQSAARSCRVLGGWPGAEIDWHSQNDVPG